MSAAHIALQIALKVGRPSVREIGGKHSFARPFGSIQQKMKSLVCGFVFGI